MAVQNYSLINIGGLAQGLAASITFVSEEFSDDEFHYLSDKVYRLNTVTLRQADGKLVKSGKTLWGRNSDAATASLVRLHFIPIAIGMGIERVHVIARKILSLSG